MKNVNNQNRKIFLKVVSLFCLIFCFPTEVCKAASYYKNGLEFSFIQNKGGMAIGQPERNQRGEVKLPVILDLSGLSRITVEPKGVNSMIVVKKFWTKVIGSEIHISVVTTFPGKSVSSKGPGFAMLGRIKDGVYKVIYDSPDGTVKLATVVVAS